MACLDIHYDKGPGTCRPIHALGHIERKSELAYAYLASPPALAA